MPNSTADVQQDRLARIEIKLDKLSDAVVSIARTEEQITTIFALHKQIETRVDHHDNEVSKLRDKAHDLANKTVHIDVLRGDVEDLEKLTQSLKLATHDNTKVIERIEKLSWLLIAMVVSIGGYLIERNLVG